MRHWHRQQKHFEGFTASIVLALGANLVRAHGILAQIQNSCAVAFTFLLFFTLLRKSHCFILFLFLFVFL